MDSDGSCPAQMAFSLAQEEVIRHYRDDRARFGKQIFRCHVCPPGKSERSCENRNQHFVH
jgi:hypothetical protein